MVLTPHAVVGAALASMVPANPALGFVLAFGSHFLLDGIPHWHYSLKSVVHDPSNPMNIDMPMGKKFVRDLGMISLDGFTGLAIPLLFFASQSPALLLPAIIGAIGGMLPDVLQFVYMKWRHEPLVSLQRFHDWIHASISLDHQHILGPLYQVAIVVLVLVVQGVVL